MTPRPLPDAGLAELLAKATPGDASLHHAPAWPFDMTIEPSGIIVRRIAYSTAAKTLHQMREAVGFSPEERDEIIELIARQEADVCLMAQARDLAAEVLRLRAALEAAQNDCRILLANIDHIRDATGEGPEDEDGVIVAQIRADLVRTTGGA